MVAIVPALGSLKVSLIYAFFIRWKNKADGDQKEKRDLGKVSSHGSIFDMDVKAQRTWMYGDAESYTGAERESLVVISGSKQDLPRARSFAEGSG